MRIVDVHEAVAIQEVDSSGAERSSGSGLRRCWAVQSRASGHKANALFESQARSQVAITVVTEQRKRTSMIATSHHEALVTSGHAGPSKSLAQPLKWLQECQGCRISMSTVNGTKHEFVNNGGWSNDPSCCLRMVFHATADE